MMKEKKKLFVARSTVVLILTFFVQLIVASEQLPDIPSQKDHPGGAFYTHSFEVIKEKVLGRTSLLYLPQSGEGSFFPVLVFGHGQFIGYKGYEETFEHLAKKGIAVLYPQYDRNFGDRNWRRMASDYNKIVSQIMKKYSSQLDPSNVTYSGHSKGAYISLVAAGSPDKWQNLKSLVLFAPAGFDKEYISELEPDLLVTLAWGENDNIIKKSLVDEIYSKINVDNKQFIEVVGYSRRNSADHYFILNKSYIFGGKNGVSPLHYYGVWKWLVAAALFPPDGEIKSGHFIYGDRAELTGVDGLRHKINRSWE